MKKFGKTIFSSVLAIALVATMGVTAFAAETTDGNAAATPQNAGGTNDSIGAATQNGSIDPITGDVTFYTTNDDDAIAAAADNDGSDINVWAKVIDSTTKVYKADIAWGDMKFQFAQADGIWNPDTHTYDATAVNAGWDEAYVNGTNNKVTVTNHSNSAVEASFAYAMDTGAFNADGTANTSVKGNFFADNAKALAASDVLADTTTVQNTLTDSKIALHTADAYSTVANAENDTNNVAAGARSGDVFFAFSGTPDDGKGADLSVFSKVGVITVTIAPTTMVGEFPAYVAP